MSEPPFPRSLVLMGLNPNFTHQQFIEVIHLERSEQICALAYDNHPYRWYLSYLQMSSEYTKDMT